MDKEKKKSLEGMLRAVQEIKSQYYVGTQEAYDVVKKISALYEIPEKTSELINRELKQKFDNPTYLATPERVIGTYEILQEKILDSEEKYFGKSLAYEFEEIEKLIGAGLSFLKRGYGYYNSNASDLAEILKPYFTYANEEKVFSNNEFKNSVVEYLGEKFAEYADEINLRFATDYYDWIRVFLIEIENENWEEKLSRDYFEKRRVSSHEDILIGLSLTDIIDRLFRDRLDHRFEYRRQTLCKYIIEEDSVDYDKLIEFSELSIKQRIERYKRLVNLNAPNIVIENEEKMIRSSKFIRHLLGSEKNFVKRYLEH